MHRLLVLLILSLVSVPAFAESDCRVPVPGEDRVFNIRADLKHPAVMVFHGGATHSVNILLVTVCTDRGELLEDFTVEVGYSENDLDAFVPGEVPTAQDFKPSGEISLTWQQTMITSNRGDFALWAAPTGGYAFFLDTLPEHVDHVQLSVVMISGDSDSMWVYDNQGGAVPKDHDD